MKKTGRGHARPVLRSTLISELFERGENTSVAEIHPDAIHQMQGGGITLRHTCNAVFGGDSCLAAQL